MTTDSHVWLVRVGELSQRAPYADAAVAEGPSRWVFTAGACPLDEQGAVVATGDASQAEQVMANLRRGRGAADRRREDNGVRGDRPAAGSGHGLGGCPPPLRKPRGSQHPPRRGRAGPSGPARGGRGRRCAPMRPRSTPPVRGILWWELSSRPAVPEARRGIPRTTSAGGIPDRRLGRALWRGTSPSSVECQMSDRRCGSRRGTRLGRHSVRPSVACSLMLIWLQGGPSTGKSSIAGKMLAASMTGEAWFHTGDDHVIARVPRRLIGRGVLERRLLTAGTFRWRVERCSADLGPARWRCGSLTVCTRLQQRWLALACTSSLTTSCGSVR